MAREEKINRILERVRKAIRLAGDNPNDAEAKTAMLLAQEMLAKHGLSMDDVSEDKEYEKDVVIKDAFEPKGRILWWKKSLAVVMANNFRCKTFIGRVGDKSTIKFMGLKEDVDVVIEVYKFAEEVIARLANSHADVMVSKTGISGKRADWRNRYITGFLDGLEEGYAEQVAKNNWEMVLVTDALVVKEFDSLTLRKKKNTGIQPRFSNDEYSRSKGYEDGKRFSNNKSTGEIE